MTAPITSIRPDTSGGFLVEADMIVVRTVERRAGHGTWIQLQLGPFSRKSVSHLPRAQHKRGTATLRSFASGSRAGILSLMAI